jgi:DNA-binding MarR family transcriptional regulator
LDQLEDLLMRMGRRFAIAKRDGITPTQFMLLRWLQDRGEMPMSEVADVVGITMAGATGLVDRLVHAGLVQRERREDDRRIVVIRLTEAGSREVELAHRRRFKYFRALTAPLSDDDLANLHRILGVLLHSRLEEGEPRE